MKELLRAAQRGSASEQFNLGVLYDSNLDDNGYAVTPRRAEAIKWLTRAARQGLPRAQVKLAELYARGDNLPQDHIIACAWFLVASKSLRAQGGIYLHVAQSGYESIASRLTPTELDEVRRVAQAWQSKYCPGAIARVAK